MSPFLSRRPRSALVDDPAVAQDGDPIAEVEHLFEAMGYVEDRDAVARKIADDREQLVALGTRKGCGRLVHRDHAGVAHQRLADHHQPALGDGEVGDPRLEREVHADTFGRGAGAGARTLPVDQTEAGRLRHAEQHVLQGAEMGNQIEFLVDEGEPGLLRRLRRALTEVPRRQQ